MQITRDDEQRRLAVAIAELTDRLGRSPNVSELAAHLGADREDVIEDLTWRRTLSHDSAELSAQERSDRIAPAENFDLLECQLAEFIDLKGLPLLLGVLSEQERRIVLLRLAKSLPQSKIAQRLGVSPAAVSRILTRSLATLREFSAGRDPLI